VAPPDVPERIVGAYRPCLLLTRRLRPLPVVPDRTRKIFSYQDVGPICMGQFMKEKLFLIADKATISKL